MKKSDVILSSIAIISLIFNLHQYRAQSRQQERFNKENMIAEQKHTEELKRLHLKIEKMQEQSDTNLQYTSDLKSTAVKMQNTMVTLKFTNYRLFTLCKNKALYSKNVYENKISDINNQRFIDIRNFSESYTGSDNLKRAFGKRIYDNTLCYIQWNIRLYDYIEKNKDCLISDTSKIPVCDINDKNNNDICELDKFDLANFDKQLHHWHQCQAKAIDDFMEKKGIKLTSSTLMNAIAV